MALRLPDVPAEQTAILVLDLQNGLFGPHADEERAQELLANTVLLAEAARSAGVRVVHCTKFDRPGFVGWSTNTPAWRARARRAPEPMLQDSPAASVVAELGPAPSDLVVPRSRGASAFMGTELDPILRNIGCRAVVIVGISINIAVMAACTDAISLGYEVVIPTDAVLGFPYDYGEAVVEHSLRVMATLTTSKALADHWRTGGGPS